MAGELRGHSGQAAAVPPQGRPRWEEEGRVG